MDSHTSPTLNKAVISLDSLQELVDFDQTYRLGVFGEELIPGNVDGIKILHVGQKDICLYHSIHATPSGLKYSLEILESHACAICYRPRDEFISFWVNADRATAVHHAVELDGLGELREGSASSRRNNRLPIRHGAQYEGKEIN